MRVCDEKFRELWHYPTTLGNLWFNVLCSFCNVVQILTVCIILGYYHSHVKTQYLWWPILECVRLFVLTIARIDVMLKEPQYMSSSSSSSSSVSAYYTNAAVVNNNDNNNNNNAHRRVGENTRRLIIGCNIAGLLNLLIALPLFLIFLPSSHKQDVLYILFLTIFPLFLLLRVILTIPMFVAVICGTSFYRSYDGNNYERIADRTSPQKRNAATASLSNSQDSPANLPYADVPQEVLWSLYENRQTQMAIEASQRDSYRYLRTQQDKEYEELLQQQMDVEKSKKNNNSLTSAVSINVNENDGVNDDGNNWSEKEKNNKSKEKEIVEDNTSNLKTAKESSDVDIVINESESLQLDPLVEEPSNEQIAVRVRIRLPNGARCIRLFANENRVGDLKCWINHELANNNLAQVINRFRLISTHPRIVYDENDKTLTQLGFWKPNVARQSETPMLYVECLD